MRVVRLFCDGASKGNPGPAGVGGVCRDEAGAVLFEFSEAIGVATNNVAEYRALIRGLQLVSQLPGDTTVLVCADSELMVRQLTGIYKIRDAALQLLAQEVERLKRLLRRCELRHIPREDNKEADRLASAAVIRPPDETGDLFHTHT